MVAPRRRPRARPGAGRQRRVARLPAAELKQNLAAIIEPRSGDIAVLLAGMEAPELRRGFTREFRGVPDSAKTHRVRLIRFLDGVAGHPALNQPDGDPNPRGTA
jgi:hypothetical protein